MSYSDAARSVTAIAAIDLSALTHHFGIYTNAGKVTSGTTTLTAQGRVDGVIGSGVAADRAFNFICPDGAIVPIKLGATLTAGARVATAADGRAVALGSSNGNQCWGILLEGGDANEIVPMKFQFSGQVNA